MLASNARVTERTVQRVETGQTPALQTLRALAEALEVPVAELVQLREQAQEAGANNEGTVPIEGDPARPAVIVEDNPVDRRMLKLAWEQGKLPGEPVMLADGQELTDYVSGRGAWGDNGRSYPSLVVLDLATPRKHGADVLREFRADPNLKHIPIVVLSASEREQDVARAYELGANAYITKPASFDALVKALTHLRQFFFQTVKLPDAGTSEPPVQLVGSADSTDSLIRTS